MESTPEKYREKQFLSELRKLKAEFNKLIELKIAALKDGNLILAHELTCKVHKIASELSRREIVQKEVYERASVCDITAMGRARIDLEIVSFLKRCLSGYVQSVRIGET